MPFLQSLTSLFSGQAGPSSRNSRVVSTDPPAFSLPTSRYADVNTSASSSPGPSRRGSHSYNYPPRSNSYQPSNNLHPPLSHTFHRLRVALVDSFPELLETLNPPVNPDLLVQFERELGSPLPPAVRDSFAIADGQDIDSGCAGLFYGLHLLPLEDVMREWHFWRQAEHDPAAGKNPALLATMASVPPTWIKQLYACRGWIPLLTDRTGNYVGVDLDPGEGGSWGQVIVFGRDFDRKCVLWRGDGEAGWGKWLSAFVDEIESGDGWEADKSSSSDEDEEAGYGSYNGGASYGESGKGLKLAGEYRGWGVLEAWWDKSVRQWESIGHGMDIEGIEKGLEEARRLARLDGAEENTDQLEVGMRTGESAAQVEIPVISSPSTLQAPPTPTPRDSDVLLPPSSPETSTARQKARIPVRIITPITTASDHPLGNDLRVPEPAGRDIGSGYLSPPGGRRRTKRVPPPAPAAIDLPTRADIQAMAAIAQAESSGLRGGWIMNMDPGLAARKHGRADSGMVDIDLESGKAQPFGSPRVSAEEMERLREEEKMSLAGIDQRSPRLISTSRTPSPLSREGSFDSSPSRVNGLQRPAPTAIASDTTIRRHGTLEEDRDQPVVRTRQPMNRVEREHSVISIDSQDGLLDARSQPSRTGSPVIGGERASSPALVVSSPAETERAVNGPLAKGLEDAMEEISLEGDDAKAVPAQLREVAV